ncbi:hypothetical protein I4U23_014828 [Adineta vaga]|nr:hypothetical protein I4U23_014828 [Adineta vaga]
MRIVFAVLLLFIACAASYPSNQETDNALELKLRSILDQLNDEEMTQSSTEDDDDDESFSKRQGGHNLVNKGTKCEIECVGAQRHPSSGKGKNIKEAVRICKNKCLIRGGKTPIYKGKPKYVKPMKTRAFIEEDDDSDNSEDQDAQRRELYDYLMEQIQRNNNE